MGSARRYGLNELSGLCQKLEERIETAGEGEVVEWIRRLAEMIIYGEQEKEPMYFEMFVERNMLKLLVCEATRDKARRPRVEAQVLQTLAILVQNVMSSHSLYLLLSSNHLNILIERGESILGRRHDESQSAFVALLKTVSLRLDAETVQFFIDNDASRFPLHDCAARLVGFVKDPMARTAALTTLLNIYKINDPHLRKFILSHADTFLSSLGTVLETELRTLYAQVRSKRSASLVSSTSQLHDLFYYAQDILLLDVLSEPLEDYLVAFFETTLCRPLLDRSDPILAACAAYVAALFVLALFSQLNSSTEHSFSYHQDDVSSTEKNKNRPRSVSLDFKQKIFDLCLRSLPLEKLLAGDDALGEPVAASTLCLLDALRRLAPRHLLDAVGLTAVRNGHSSTKKASSRKRQPSTQAKAILETLVVSDSAVNFKDQHDGEKSLFEHIFDEVGNHDSQTNDTFEEQTEIPNPNESALIRTRIRLGLLGCLDHFEFMSLGTLRAATNMLSTLPVAPDEPSHAPTVLRPVLARAATAYAREVDDDRVFDLDKAVAALHDWCRHYASHRQRTRSAGQNIHYSSSSDDDDEDDDTMNTFFSQPTARLSPNAALLNREADFEIRDPLHSLLAVAHAYSVQLVPSLLEHFLDAQPPLGSMRLAGKKCLPCSTLRPRRATTPPPSPHIIGETIDLYLVLDDASLILAVPDPLALSTGRILAAAPLHAILALVDTDDGTKLDLIVAPPYSLQSLAFPSAPQHHSPGPGAARLTLNFDSESSCRIAFTFLADRRAAERDKRRQRLQAKLYEIADPACDLFPAPVVASHSDLIPTAPPRLTSHASSDPLVVK